MIITPLLMVWQKTVLEYASLAAETLDKTPPSDWRHVAANIPILQFPDGTTKENETYAGQIIKQADANLLSYPLKIITEKEAILRDLNYYEPRLSPDGHLQWGELFFLF